MKRITSLTLSLLQGLLSGRFWCSVAVAGTLLTGGRDAKAQLPPRSVPSDEHFAAFRPYLAGDFLAARRLFAAAPRVRSTEAVWIDSIPYHAMIGECLYHMGDLNGALEQYTLALQVYLRYPDWMLRLNMPDVIQPSAAVIRKPPNWGVSARTIRVALIPDRIGSREGNTDADNLRALQQGGVISTQQIVRVGAKEIARCIALAIRRRGEILGTTGESDPVNNELVTTLSRRPAPPNHWSQAWISVQLGLAQACKGKVNEAAAELNNSLLMAGMDHNLTSTALLELGRLAFRAQDLAAAATFFQEATFSAGVLSQDDFTQYDVLVESFRGAMLTHVVMGRPEFFAPLAMAGEWSLRGPQILEGGIALLAADSALTAGDLSLAGQRLEQAAQTLRRRECLQGELGGRLQFLSAHAQFARGDTKAGGVALANALKYAARGSRRLFQIGRTDVLFTSGAITTRQASLLYEEVLRDPTPRDWLIDPLESLAVLTVPHPAAYENWMMLALDRREEDVALRISDALRRHRFYSAIPLGGRMLNLRWLWASPAESLPPAVLARRRDLLQRDPRSAELADRATRLRAELAALPILGENAEQQTTINNLQAQLAEVGATQERILESVALGRLGGDLLFPPPADVAAVRQALKPRQRILAFSSIKGATFAFLLGTESYSTWQLESPAKVRNNLVKLLREMGQYDRNQPLGIKELSSSAWKTTAAEVLAQLTGNAPASAWDEFDELIIVPDGQLWYLPFEALQIRSGDTSIALIDKVRIRYAPTLSLAVPDPRPRKRVARTLVVAGTIFPRAEAETADELLGRLRDADPLMFGPSAKTPPVGTLLPKTVDRLLVLNDLDNDARGPFDWSPVGGDRGKSISLDQWMMLPWGAPDEVLLPGFHTPAETALKRAGTGDELFLAACAMMASGSRTILLSRWRDGGRTSYDLIREFARELPHRTASEAWQRSVQMARETELDAAREPRVRLTTADSAVRADHPFFWAGYLLVDAGVEPKSE